MTLEERMEILERRNNEMPLEKRIKMLEQDADWLWDDGYYSMAIRMARLLEILKKD